MLEMLGRGLGLLLLLVVLRLMRRALLVLGSSVALISSSVSAGRSAAVWRSIIVSSPAPNVEMTEAWWRWHGLEGAAGD